MKFRDLVNKKEQVNEDVQGINNSGIGYLITYSMYMIAQTHIWHLLCKSGQKHTALGEFYEEMQDEVDSLAEDSIFIEDKITPSENGIYKGEYKTINHRFIKEFTEI